MCEMSDEIQTEQLAIVLARARQQRVANKPKEKPLETVAQ